MTTLKSHADMVAKTLSGWEDDPNEVFCYIAKDAILTLIASVLELEAAVERLNVFKQSRKPRVSLTAERLEKLKRRITRFR